MHVQSSRDLLVSKDLPKRVCVKSMISVVYCFCLKKLKHRRSFAVATVVLHTSIKLLL